MANLEASSLFGVKGMVFVVTGGGSGIGAMMAKALDINGAAKVYVVGRRKEKLEETAKAATNGSVVVLQGDTSSKDDLKAMADRIASEVGFVNAVIANHGTTGPNLDDLPKDREPTLSEYQSFLWKTSMEDFTQTYNINITSIFFTLLAFMPLLDQGNRHKNSPTVATGIKSQFIATASIGAFSRRPSMGFAYAGSKAALIHTMKQCATCLAPYDIRSNVIAPGVYPSDMSNHFLAATKDTGISTSLIPAGRAGTEEDAAGATLFLCSRGGAYLNGNVIITDGGRLSVVPGTY